MASTRWAARDQRGAVTAEAALVIPLLLVVTAACLWLVAVMGTKIRVLDAAREAARSAARGDSEVVATAYADRVAPGSRVTLRRDGGSVEVVVEAHVVGHGLLGVLGDQTVRGRAVAAEEGVDGGR